MYIYGLILIAGLLSGFAGGWKVQAWRHDAAALEAQEQVRKDERENRATEREDRDNVVRSINASRSREQAARLAESGARTELDSLRRDADAFKRDVSSVPAAACPERAASAADVFESCAAALADMAGKADRHASDALMLREAWPK